jgi:VanZ family protein
MTSRPHPVVLGVITALSFAVTAVVGFWPTPVDRPVDGTIARLLRHLHAHGLPAWFGYNQVESLANVLFFVPIGLLLCLLFSRPFWYLAVVGGVLTSATIEVGQLLFLPARYASWGDILANSIGTLIGVGIAVTARTVAARRRTRRSRQAQPA